MQRLISADEWEPRGIPDLEPNADAVVRSAVSMCVTAGPGAGKTELLAQRASFLLETGACPYPKRILAISFKRDAAKNVRERVQQRSGEMLARRFDSYTFDAFAKGMLDQFLATLPVELRPSPDYELLLRGLAREEIEEILLGLVPPPDLDSADGLRALARSSFLSDDVPKAPLFVQPGTLAKWAAREFWRVLLHERPPSQLTFPMITRLAGELARRDARILRAYRNTYSYVFIDEFQDTTALQYWFTRVLFRNTATVLTAVGDPQQRIMGWAGALRTAFDGLQRDFAARPTLLVRNHRASAEIAPLVRFVAGELRDGHATSDELRAGPSANSCSAHIFLDEQSEAAWVAAEVEQLFASGVASRDIGILVRMRTSEYGARIIEALRARGRVARVEDRIQDLLSEPVVEACVLGLRALLCARPRHNWARFRELVAESRGITWDDEHNWARTEAQLADERQRLRGLYPDGPPEEGDEAGDIVRGVAQTFLAGLRRRYPQYRRGNLYDTSLGQLAEALASVNGDWEARLDEIEGVTAVPILTIHKSKGLEYHAVFFIGLEDGAFWNFRRDPDEESNAFFVALSRAKERVMFTFCRSRTRRGRRESQTMDGIAVLYDLMQRCGVQTIEHGMMGD